MKKKAYISPAMQVTRITPSYLIAGSANFNTNIGGLSVGGDANEIDEAGVRKDNGWGIGW